MAKTKKTADTEPPATEPPATEPVDPQTKQLLLEKTRAEAQKAIAEANKATLTAQLPQGAGEVKPLEGKVDVGEKAGLVGRLIAFGLLDHGAEAIAKAVASHVMPGKGSGPARVLLVDDRGLAASDWSYRVVTEQLASEARALASALKALGATEDDDGKTKPPRGAREIGPATAVAAAPALLSAAAGVVGMLKTDYSIAGEDLTVGTTPLMAAVAEKLLAQKSEVVVDGFDLVESEVVKRFWAARVQRFELEAAVARLKATNVTPADHEIEDLRAELKDASAALDKALGESEKTPPGLADLTKRVTDLSEAIATAVAGVATDEGLVATVETILARFDAFTTTVTTAAKEGDPPPLVAAALRERLHEAPKDGPARHTHVLFVGVEGGGTETVTRHGLFTRSGRVSYLGGANVSYLLLDVERNSLVAAGNEQLLGQMPYDLKKNEPGPVKRIALGGAR